MTIKEFFRTRLFYLIASITVIVLILVFALRTGSSPKHPDLVKEERFLIKAVFLHEPGHYSVMVEGRGGQLINQNVVSYAKWWAHENEFEYGFGTPISSVAEILYKDVPTSGDEYLLLRGKGVDVTAEIHIRDIRSVGGGGWSNNQKPPEHFQTVPIQ